MSVCEESIFKKVYNQHQRALQHYLQARGLDIQSAADQVQECFIRLWKNCREVTQEKSLSYLYTIASRLHIDEYRKSKIRLKYISSAKTNQHENKDGQYMMEEAEFKAKLEHVLNTMTEKSKTVFLMNRYDKMTYKDIASSLDISVKAVEKRMSKALKHLITHKIRLKK